MNGFRLKGQCGVWPLFGMAAAVSMLTASAEAQIPGPSIDRPTAAEWRMSRFDLSQLAPQSTAAVRDVTTGVDTQLAPGLVGSLEAADIQRGAAAANDTNTPLFQRQAELSGRMGLLVNGRSLLFGRLGYAEFDVAQAFPRAGSRELSAGGVLVGAGAETRLSPALSLKTEYKAVDYSPGLSNRQVLGGLAWHY